MEGTVSRKRLEIPHLYIEYVTHDKLFPCFLYKCIRYIGLVCSINGNTGKNVIMLQKCAK